MWPGLIDSSLSSLGSATRSNSILSYILTYPAYSRSLKTYDNYISIKSLNKIKEGKYSNGKYKMIFELKLMIINNFMYSALHIYYFALIYYTSIHCVSIFLFFWEKSML